MRQIGTIDDETKALRFVDFLKTLDISASAEQDDSLWVVWVREENQLEVARQELAKFAADPQAQQYRQAGDRAQEIRSKEIQKKIKARKNHHKVRGNWSGPMSKRAPVVMGLIIACIAAAVLGGGFGTRSTVDDLLMFANTFQSGFNGDPFYNIKAGQVWRLITPIFLHGSLPHIAFNLYMLYVLGTQIEGRLGSRRFLGLVLATAIAPNIMQAVLVHPNFLGISGVVYGLVGYMLVRREDGYRLDPFWLMIIAVFFVLDFAQFIPGRHIAVWSHAGGLATGALVGYLPKLLQR